jgi:hypothetical protein
VSRVSRVSRIWKVRKVSRSVSNEDGTVLDILVESRCLDNYEVAENQTRLEVTQ